MLTYEAFGDLSLFCRSTFIGTLRKSHTESLPPLQLVPCPRLCRDSVYLWCCEAAATKLRLDVIKAVAVLMLQQLHSKADSCYQDLNDWLGAEFLQEMNRFH